MRALSPAQRQARAVKSRNHAQKFTWEKAAREMIAIYSQLQNGKA
jgi:glycogen synthase